MEGDQVGKGQRQSLGEPWPTGRGLVYGTISGNAEVSLAGVSPAGTGTSYLSPKGKVIACENLRFPHTLHPRELPSC